MRERGPTRRADLDRDWAKLAARHACFPAANLLAVHACRDAESLRQAPVEMLELVAALATLAVTEIVCREMEARR